MEKSAQISTEHADMVHDAQPDYYGKRVATCSSDRTIKIFENANEAFVQVAELKGHEGPVWQVCWGHPKFGVLLASCGYDRKVIVWKEGAKNVWERVYVYEGHELSVNSVAFAPHEFGLILGCASSDGHVSIHTYSSSEGKWDAIRFFAHQIGVNSISWAPAVVPGTLLRLAPSQQPPLKRFATGGCDKLVKVWQFSQAENKWQGDQLKGHTDWVRDVAWSPNMASTASVLASCSQDKSVIIWTQEDPSPEWNNRLLHTFPEIVWRVSWSLTGNILAVSSADNKVTLWKESLQREPTWTCLSALDENTE
jgi:protein transport protein SEC13